MTQNNRYRSCWKCLIPAQQVLVVNLLSLHHWRKKQSVLSSWLKSIFTNKRCFILFVKPLIFSRQGNTMFSKSFFFIKTNIEFSCLNVYRWIHEIINSKNSISVRDGLYLRAENRYQKDGVNRVLFNRLALEFQPLYTWVYVNTSELLVMQVSLYIS